MDLSINIVTWNSMEFLPDLLKTIMSQTYKDFNVLVVDNGSNDGIEAFLREEYPSVTLLRNPRNQGFSAAHNQGIRYNLDHWDAAEHGQKFVLVCNPDILMHDRFLENLMRVAKSDDKAGSFGGKLLRAFGENLGDEVLRETVRSQIIDSVALNAHRNRTVSDMGAGEKDEGQYDDLDEVFGVTGAMVLYRASALSGVRYKDEFFDHDFFAYKEDVDMAWRLQRAGWTCRVVPKAIAYHYRGMYGKEASGLWDRVKNRRKKSSMRNYYSTRNHWLMLLKNLSFTNGLLGLPWILTYEFSRFVYLILFEPSNLKAVADLFKLVHKMHKKRSQIMSSTDVSNRRINGFFL
ncbi:glycosyltransferase family 2 protein [Candidatus Uhrbacteria bacterium]|jgi:GT2 family glycosyltransferase|nr:glycosyltransferase family 2 protein [Candidatus Uhrbacteria bacterium]